MKEPLVSCSRIILAASLLHACGSSQVAQGDAHDGGGRGDYPVGDHHDVSPVDRMDDGEKGDGASDGPSDSGLDRQQPLEADDGASAPDAVVGTAANLPCEGCTLLAWDIWAERLAYDARRNHLYATVAGAAPHFPNSLVTIDVDETRVVLAQHVGSQPSALAISEDGSTLWVSVIGALAMRKVTLTTEPPTMGPLHRLKLLPKSGPLAVQHIIPLPGMANSLLVTVGGIVTVLDDLVPRINFSGAFSPIALVLGPPGYAFARAGLTHDFAVLTINEMGVLPTVYRNLIDPIRLGTAMAYAGGRLFFENGQTIDMTDPGAPRTLPSLPVTGRIAVRSPNRLMMISQNGDLPAGIPWRLTVIDTVSLTEVSSVSLPASVLPGPDPFGVFVSEFIYAGNDIAAFVVHTPDARGSLEGKKRLYLLKSPVLGPS